MQRSKAQEEKVVQEEEKRLTLNNTQLKPLTNADLDELSEMEQYNLFLYHVAQDELDQAQRIRESAQRVRDTMAKREINAGLGEAKSMAGDAEEADMQRAIRESMESYTQLKEAERKQALEESVQVAAERVRKEPLIGDEEVKVACIKAAGGKTGTQVSVEQVGATQVSVEQVGATQVSVEQVGATQVSVEQFGVPGVSVQHEQKLVITEQQHALNVGSVEVIKAITTGMVISDKTSDKTNDETSDAATTTMTTATATMALTSSTKTGTTCNQTDFASRQSTTPILATMNIILDQVSKSATVEIPLTTSTVLTVQDQAQTDAISPLTSMTDFNETIRKRKWDAMHQASLETIAVSNNQKLRGRGEILTNKGEGGGEARPKVGEALPTPYVSPRGPVGPPHIPRWSSWCVGGAPTFQ